jgi:hypothetical protein
MPETTSSAAVDTILRTVEVGASITDARLDAYTTAPHCLLDERRHHRGHMTTGPIVPAGPRCPIWTVLE